MNTVILSKKKNGKGATPVYAISPFSIFFLSHSKRQLCPIFSQIWQIKCHFPYLKKKKLVCGRRVVVVISFVIFGKWQHKKSNRCGCSKQAFKPHSKGNTSERGQTIFRLLRLIRLRWPIFLMHTGPATKSGPFMCALLLALEKIGYFEYKAQGRT